MSESRAKLEQILELLLAEDNAKAEEMLHEYVVAKARAEYERVLDESEEEVEEVEETVDSEDEDAVEETIDQSNDFEQDILADESEIESDESGFSEGDDEGEEEGGEESDDDLEDKVDDLEAELEDLRAEFEKLMAGEDDMDMGDEETVDMDMDMDDAGEDEMMDSVEYDLDEEVEDGEVVEEATKLSNAVAAPKNAAETSASPFTKAPKHTSVTGAGAPVRIKDGGAGNAGANKAKDHTPTNNIGLKPAKVNVPKA